MTVAIGAASGARTGPSQAFVGEVRVADIGLVDEFRSGIVEDSDMCHWAAPTKTITSGNTPSTVFAGFGSHVRRRRTRSRGSDRRGGIDDSAAGRQGADDVSASLPPEVVRFTGTEFDSSLSGGGRGSGAGRDVSPWLEERLRSRGSGRARR